MNKRQQTRAYAARRGYTHTVNQAAVKLGLSPSQIRRRIASGALSAIQAGAPPVWYVAPDGYEEPQRQSTTKRLQEIERRLDALEAN